MNKDELLKIYSAYLPYNLNVQLSAKDTCKNGVFPLIGIRNDGLFYMGESGMFGYVQLELGAVKPILYDISYLTKPIEHEGETIIPAEFVFGKNHNIREVKDVYIINKNGYSFRATDLSFKQVQKLLELHFNAFNLPEDQFINKATLTNK